VYVQKKTAYIKRRKKTIKKRPMYVRKRPACIKKRPMYVKKRPAYIKKRPTQETNKHQQKIRIDHSIPRQICQKKPIKETYTRDLYTSQRDSV